MKSFLIIFAYVSASQLTQTTCPLHINSENSRRSHRIDCALGETAERERENALLQHIFPNAHSKA